MTVGQVQTVEWTTGLDYWTELFSLFWTSFSIYLYVEKAYIFQVAISSLWMIVLVTIVVYCSVFICMYLKIPYIANSLRWNIVMVFSGLIGNHT